MLRHKVDLELTDRSGGTALHGAAYSGHVGCVQLLLQFGACVNTTDAVNQTALFRACEKGHAEVVKVLLESKYSRPGNSDTTGMDVSVVHLNFE